MGSADDQMDILAAMLAYLVSVTAMVGAVVISFVVFFSSPQSSLPLLPAQQAEATVATPDPVTTIAAAAVPAAGASEPVKIAADVRQKHLLSTRQLRRLADKQRARRLAFRESSSFEARFLHYAD